MENVQKWLVEVWPVGTSPSGNSKMKTIMLSPRSRSYTERSGLTLEDGNYNARVIAWPKTVPESEVGGGSCLIVPEYPSSPVVEFLAGKVEFKFVDLEFS